MKTLHLGKIFTSSSTPLARAMLLEDGLVKGIGAPEEFPHYDQQVTHKGFVMPAFNDSHCHLLGIGITMDYIALAQAKSIADVIRLGKAGLEGKEILLGRGWNQDYFIDRRLLTAKDLDQISEEIPIIFYRACGHILTANTPAMKAAGHNKLDGIFRENEMDLIKAIIPPPSIPYFKERILAASDYLLGQGICSVQSDDLAATTPDYYDDVFTAFEELARDHALPMKVYEQAKYDTPARFKRALDRGYVQGKAVGRFIMGPLKILGDGSLGARTAALLAPYADEPTALGQYNHTDEELTAMLDLAHQAQMDTAIHAIGDGMLAKAVNGLKPYGATGRRHAIVHCQITRPDLVKDMKVLGIGAMIQPIFLHYDLHIAKDRLGQDRLENAYQFKSLGDDGIQLAFGSDAPVEAPNPFHGLYCAISRKDLKGQPAKGFFPDQAFSRGEALNYYTAASAYFEYQDHQKGKLLPGYAADFIEVSEDLLTCTEEQVRDAYVVRTYLDGELVYEKGTSQ